MAARKRNYTTEIKAANKVLMDCLKAGDVKGAAACYSKGAVLLAPNAKPIKSHRKIAEYWQGALDMGIKNVVLKTQEVSAHGTTAIEMGAYTLKGARNKTLDAGKFIVVWTREGRSWKLHRDIFNSNNPA